MSEKYPNLTVIGRNLLNSFRVPAGLEYGQILPGLETPTNE
jgi:hypothetical protein